MKTPTIGNIAASIPNGKKNKFNLSHDNNTTWDWGSVQPILSKMMMPDSSINVNMEQLTRCAPMVVPTFGRVKVKNIAHFVSLQDIFPNWDAMMSQTKVTRTSNVSGALTTNVYVPKIVPHISNNILTAWILCGAKVNFYFSGAVGTDAENDWFCARNTGTWSTPAGWPAATTATREYINKMIFIQNSNTPTTANIAALNYTGYAMNLRRLILNSTTGSAIINSAGGSVTSMPTISTMTAISLPNANGTGYTHSASNEQNTHDSSLGDDHISFEGADLIWEYDGNDPSIGISSADRAANSGTPIDGISNSQFDGCKIRFVFKLSSFGKRLRKILIGLGYDVNLANDDNVSILPLIAYYKAWWDSYAPERTKNFYETNAWKLVQASMQNANAASLDSMFNVANNVDYRDYFRGLMSDLGTCFATEKMDVISAATDQYYGQTDTTTAGVGSRDVQVAIMNQLRRILNEPYGDAAQKINADGSAYIQNTTTYQNLNGIGKYFDVNNGNPVLTQPQIDSLKKGYIMMNKCSVAGMVTEQILRALGQGDYVEECKGKFINSKEDAIKISDVVATAATQEAKLGQYGGRGLGLGNYQFSFETNKWGYLIVLSTIVPESGYINAPVHENEVIRFEQVYQRELDGLAYEAIQKKNITGSPLMNDGSYRDTFGYLPTYTQWKFMSNKANGDFSLNSRKNYMTPYTLDKYIPVADTNVYKTMAHPTYTGTSIEICSPTFKYSDLPNAGEDYRYINKYPWNGNYNRIFDAEGDGIEWSVFSPNNNAFLFCSFEYDNFMGHNVFEINYWAHMKSIEESYSTYDEEHEAPNGTIKRS